MYNGVVLALFMVLIALVAWVGFLLQKIEERLVKTPWVKVTKETKELYDEIVRCSGAVSNVLRISQGAVEYLGREFSNRIQNCKVQSVRVYGVPDSAKISLHGTTYQIHITAELNVGGFGSNSSGEKMLTRLNCNFVFNPRDKAAELIWVGPN